MQQQLTHVCRKVLAFSNVEDDRPPEERSLYEVGVLKLHLPGLAIFSPEFLERGKF